jgi:thymidine phosphorylase
LLVASILSKKIAAGSSHVLIDVPLGATAKVRSQQAAEVLQQRLYAVAEQFGIHLQVHMSDGEQPVGRGIGPALEAWDVLAVLQGEDHAPQDLRSRALCLAGILLEMAGKAPLGEGRVLAQKMLDDGSAWRKFQAICQAQGGMRTPPKARLTHVVCAQHTGVVSAIDNRKLASIAKLAGAPKAPAAGVEFYAKLGQKLQAGQPYLTIHAESPGELVYARSYAEAQENLLSLTEGI